jgi:hypothetical protein
VVQHTKYRDEEARIISEIRTECKGRMEYVAQIHISFVAGEKDTACLKRPSGTE